MRSKFQIGDEIIFMNGSEARKETVKGISFVIGEYKTVYSEKKGTIDKPNVTYSIGVYQEVSEENAFSTKEELVASVTSKL